MKEKIFNNLSLKILSVLCAIILWAVIVNIYDPTTSVTISNVNVQLINTESLTDKDFTYEVLDGSKIAVYLSGPKSIITDIKASDIVATADLSKITAFADYVDIDVKVVKDGRTINNIEIAPRTTAVKLDIENRMTKEFTVYAETTGTVASGYVLAGTSLLPETIRITGAASLVEQIVKVKAVCDISGLSSDTSVIVPLVLCNEAGEEITDSNLELSLKEVEFTVHVSESKSVPIFYEGITGEPAKGYFVEEVGFDITEVVLTGDITKLESINSITIPSDAVDITGASENVVKEIKLSDYVGAGISVVSKNTLTIKVAIVKNSERLINYNTDNIVINNLQEGMTAEVQTSSLSVKFTGSEERLSLITEKDVTSGIDLSGLGVGEHMVSVKFADIEGVSLEGSYKVKVVIKASEPETEEESSSVEATE